MTTTNMEKLQAAVRRVIQSTPLSKASEVACIDVVTLLNEEDEPYDYSLLSLAQALANILTEFGSSKKRRNNATAVGSAAAAAAAL